MSQKIAFYKGTFKKTNIGKMPKEWKVLRLGDLLEETDIRANTQDNFKELPVLSLTKNYGLVPQKVRFTKRIAKEDVSNYKIIKKGWIVYNPYIIWEGAIDALKHTELGLISPVYITWRVMQEKANYLFLDYLFKTRPMLQTFFNLSTGVVKRRRSIKKRSFLNIQIPLPPIREQQKIALILSSIDEAIKGTDEIIQKTQVFKKGLMRRLLTKGIGHKKFKNTEIGEIPKEWRVTRIGDILQLCQYGLSIKMSTQGKFPIVRMDEIVNGYVVPTITKYVDLDKETFRTFKLEKGDILFNRTNSYELVGRTGIFLLDGDYVFASYLIRLRVKQNIIDPHFLTFYLNFSQHKLRQLATRAVQQANINAANLKKVKIPLPSFEEQRKIVKTLQIFDEIINRENETKRQLEKTKKWFMQNLLTGRIRVKVN
jgi:type I restriction enzyme S subunit